MASRLVSNCKFFENFSLKSVTRIETAFNSLGKSIALNPWRTIILCCSFTLITSFGLLRFHQEKNPIKLWVPPDSDFVKGTEWLLKTFKHGYRTQVMLVKGHDVLTPEVFRQMNDINKKVLEVTTTDGIEWSDVCFKVPFIDEGIAALLKRPNSSFEFDPTVEMDMSLYCSLLQLLEHGCMQTSVLELWKFDDRKLKYLTKEEIISQISSTNISTPMENVKTCTSRAMLPS